MSKISRHSEFRSETARHARSWFAQLWEAIALRGRKFAPIPASSMDALERAQILATSLLSARGEASGAAVSQELLEVVKRLSDDQRHLFLNFVAQGFQADPARLAASAQAYLEDPSWMTAADLAEAAEPPRQELLRRMNMAEGGTQALISLRKEIPSRIDDCPELAALDADLRHLLASWFNRGFLELRQIDWQTPAAILEKLIAHEAVHEIQGWDDLRRRLAPDRRCFAFFHPALPGEPLIFVEVALVVGLAGSVGALLDRDVDDATQRLRATAADTAIFYSISNCQAGLRGISFGNFLIKQVVEILREALPSLKHFSTLSPVPGFRRWLNAKLTDGNLPTLTLSPTETNVLFDMADALGETRDVPTMLRSILATEGWERSPEITAALKPVLLKLCAVYLTGGKQGNDPVARFHLGNGARLERLNWMGNPEKRGLHESWGIMVNYLYDPAMIEANHERFTRADKVARSREVDRLLGAAPPRRGHLWTRTS